MGTKRPSAGWFQSTVADRPEAEVPPPYLLLRRTMLGSGQRPVLNRVGDPAQQIGVGYRNAQPAADNWESVSANVRDTCGKIRS
jgi:hypothetical protein